MAARPASLPAVYALDEQGQERLVNGMMRDDLFVIDGVVASGSSSASTATSPAPTACRRTGAR